MHLREPFEKEWKRVPALLTAASLALFQLSTPVRLIAHDGDDHDQGKRTRTPIKHVIVIIGENRSFDHVFATYEPPRGQTVSNLLSKQIVNEDGTPGPKYSEAAQKHASSTWPMPFTISPDHKEPYTHLPPTNTDGAPSSSSDTSPAPFATLAAAQKAEPDLLPQDLHLLTTGATGLPTHAIDTRIPNVYNLPNGPYQLTPSIGYDDYAGSPVHRFYQMWQQSDCNRIYATRQNPSGCRNDLYPWVEVSVGAGSNGAPRTSPFTDETTHEGAISMGFYNVSQGDAPYLTYLARNYALSDNFHQSVMGGTGANHVALGTGDAIWYSDDAGHPAVPPSDQIENPNPMKDTNNFYTQDGYSGGTYSDCSDPRQPGVDSIRDYLASLPYHPKPRCADDHYYLLNNYAPGYFGDGTVNHGTFVIPPSPLRNIGDELIEHDISWKYYGGGFDLYLKDPAFSNPYNAYCDICNPFQYSSNIMTDASVRETHLKDVLDLYQDIKTDTLPAVSFVKPDGFLDGHPASSKLDLFEGFVKRIVDATKASPEVWESTAIVITFDEAGGYWDSGYIQPLDFFGDGPRIPTIVVSPYSRGGRVVHDYYDHVSILKFIEYNWHLRPLTSRSRDNFPNPIVERSNPYVPLNGPAIGNLTAMFDFDGKCDRN